MRSEMPDTFPFEIKNRWTGAVIFTAALAAELKTRARSVQLGAAVKLALATRANLTGADLTDANLTRADLTRADLTRANLTDADLTRANLTDADLTDANLTRADLTRADLTGA
ncbi:MAG: pentapeptide repeat-containing protein, partial [Azospirillum sp.]|nr:pentapeptide repeat-containing protein [Azospirillum sp.]